MIPILADALVDLALSEDLGFSDITSDSLFDNEIIAKAQIASRQSAIISGLEIAQQVFQRVDSRIQTKLLQSDGDPVTAGVAVMSIEGPVRSILKAERLALNFLQHLSGIATLTYQYVCTVSRTKTQITHTRKTLPGLRALEIEAVVHGGGSPHRKSLSHAVLIKDNHIQAAGSIALAVEKTRHAVGHTVRIEVECDTLEQVQAALDAKADIILLDNMDVATVQSAVTMVSGKAITEASGGITLRKLLEYAQTGVDVISTSEITLSAPAVDLGLDFL